MSSWDPNCYARYARERQAPFEDLFALLRVRPGLKVVDLGCGPGELTRRLADRLPASQVLGIDSSPEMLARASAPATPGLRFELGGIEGVRGAWDLVFSHAAIHWVDDHPRLIPQLFDLVRPGGQLAVQVPSNHRHPSHTLIIEVAREEPFRTALGGWFRRSPVLEINDYAELLHARGAEEMTVFEKVYPHILADAAAVAEWTRGTTLVPYLERLPVELHEPFMERYRTMLAAIWPAGPVFYPFRRTLFAAVKPA